MKVLVSGSRGLIGSALTTVLTTRRHRVVRLVRSPQRAGDEAVFWDPVAGTLAREEIEGMEAVVHLAGENIASSRWTESQKERIRASRVDGTRLLSETLAQLQEPPQVMVCASAIGFYGDRGDEIMTERSEAGQGFLAQVVREWESATAAARDKGIRVINLRLGVVMSPVGGALSRMLLAFRLGLGGRVGNGKQYMSWTSLEDAVEIICFAMNTDSLEGPVNAVSPNPVTSREFTKTLGRFLMRPTLCRMPAWLVRISMGEMGEELLLSSTRVEPRKLLDAGYPFQHETLTAAFEHML